MSEKLGYSLGPFIWPGLVTWGVAGDTLWYKLSPEMEMLWPGGKGFPTRYMQSTAAILRARLQGGQ